MKGKLPAKVAEAYAAGRERPEPAEELEDVVKMWDTVCLNFSPDSELFGWIAFS